jgi:uncharacterized protein YjbJ (UPF0337 family)
MATTEEHGRRSDAFAALIEHVGQVVDDVRKMVEERGAAEKATGKGEHRVRDALSKVGEAVRKRAKKPEAGEEASREAQRERAAGAQPQPSAPIERAAGVVRDELKEILRALAGVVEELRSIIESLSRGLEQADVRKEGLALRAGIEKARQFVQGRMAAREAPSQGAPQVARGEERREERPEEQEPRAQEGQREEQPTEAEGERQGRGEPQERGAEPKEPRREEAPQPPAAQPPEGAEPRTLALFDGTQKSAEQWTLVGSGSLRYEDGELRFEAGPDRGLAYFEARRFDDFRLRLQFQLDTASAQVGTAVRFLDPEQPVPDREDPNIFYPYDNPAYVASHTGFEILMGARRPASEPGIIENVLLGDAPGAQRHADRAVVRADDWNDLEIEVRGNRYTVRLNGKLTSEFENADSYRGKPASAGLNAGYLGLEVRSGRVRLRRMEAELFLPAEREQAEGGRAESEGREEAKTPRGARRE